MTNIRSKIEFAFYLLARRRWWCATFNLITKPILLSQLKEYGFNFKSRSLVNSYLTGRKTQCRIKGCLSGEVVLDSGVGEGSVLGPGFFICGMCGCWTQVDNSSMHRQQRQFGDLQGRISCEPFLQVSQQTAQWAEKNGRTESCQPCTWYKYMELPLLGQQNFRDMELNDNREDNY